MAKRNDVEFTAEQFVAQLRAGLKADEKLELEVAARLRRTRKLLKALSGFATAEKPAKSLRVTPGSLEHRILGLCVEPTPLKDIVAGGNAREQDVKAAVKRLRAAGRLELTGGAQKARYQAKG